MTPPDSSPKSSDDEHGDSRRNGHRWGGSDEEWTPSHSGGSSKPNAVSRYKSSSPKTQAVKRKAENHDSEGSHFKKTTKKVQVILESFGSHNGVGDKLHELLPNHLDSADAVAAFLLFVHERQKIWKRKYTGKRQTLTKNNVLSTQWFTNMYRELDRGTMYLRKCLLQDELKDRAPSNTIDQELVHSVLFKSVVYRLINKVETFMDFGGLPTPKDFTTFLKFLAEKKSQNEVIFTCAHQNMGYERLLKTLHFARKNSASLASQVIKAAENKSLKMAHKTLLSRGSSGSRRR